jgi:hypothetical protein
MTYPYVWLLAVVGTAAWVAKQFCWGTIHLAHEW